MLRLHWGEPKNLAEVRSCIGATFARNGPPSFRYVSHEIKRWYGISSDWSGFLGLMVFGRTAHPRSAERPSRWPEDEGGRS